MATSSQRVNAVEGAVTEVIDLDCASTALVGDLIRVSTTIPDFAEVATDNLTKEPIVGRIKSKKSPTRAVVVLRGVIDVAPSLPSGRVFLSAFGSFTTSKITENYHQELGYSFGNGKMHLQPNPIVTKLT